jgi:hypothetical protein
MDYPSVPSITASAATTGRPGTIVPKGENITVETLYPQPSRRAVGLFGSRLNCESALVVGVVADVVVDGQQDLSRSRRTRGAALM